MKKIANIDYLKELYKKINGDKEQNTKVPVDNDAYCPTYKEITSGKYFDYSDGTTKGLMVGTQYSVDDTTNRKYEDNQCVCEIDILAVIPRLAFLKVIDKDTLTYKQWATVDCMVDFKELSTGKTPYSDQDYLKLQLECDNYQKKDDGKEIEYSSSIVDLQFLEKNGTIKQGISFSGDCTTNLKDNLSTKEHKYRLKAKIDNNMYTNEIEIKQAGETYGFYDKDGTWVNAIDYENRGFINDKNRKTKGWLDDYGDNVGTKDGGRDIYNLDNTDYKRGIELTTNIQPYLYNHQSYSSDSSKYKERLQTYDNSNTYHIAFADDANKSGLVGDSYHWFFREEVASVYLRTKCHSNNYEDGVGTHRSYSAGTTQDAYYVFEYNRYYFKPQHCYGKTSIDRIYKLDKNGQYRLGKDGNKKIDKGYDDNGILHLNGNGSKYPKHWRSQVAYYKTSEGWDDITGDTLSNAKITVFESTYVDSSGFKPSNRNNGTVSKMDGYKNINFPDNKGGANKYYAYPFYHFLSKEQCVFNDETKMTYHRDETKNSVTNYETGQAQVYPYNVSAHSSYYITQDNGNEYLVYYYGDGFSYGKKYCSSEQKTMPIILYREIISLMEKVVTKEDSKLYYQSGGSAGENKRKPMCYSTYEYNIIIDYGKTSDYGRRETNEYSYNTSSTLIEYTDVEDFPDDINQCKELWYDYEYKRNGKEWKTKRFYLSNREDKRYLEQNEYKATVPYQKGTFNFKASPTNTVSAKITGDLSQYATTKITYNSGNGGDGTVEVKIDYGVDGKEAKSGDLVITDKEGHTLTFPIDYSESITMGQAREAAKSGYVAINGGTSVNSDNYWCTSKKSKGDAGKEDLSIDVSC